MFVEILFLQLIIFTNEQRGVLVMNSILACGENGPGLNPTVGETSAGQMGFSSL